MIRRAIPLLIKAAVSVGLLAVLFAQMDVSAIVARVRHIDVRWAAMALAMYAVMIGLSAWRWQVLLRVIGVDAPFGALTNSWLVATFFNNFLPSNIGGDVVRIADSASLTGSRTVAATVVLLDRAVGLVALLGVAALGAYYASRQGLQVPGATYLVAAAFGAIAIGAPALLAPRLIPRVLRPITRLRPGFLEERADRLALTIERIVRRPGLLALTGAGAVAVQLVLVGFYLATARSLNIPLPVLQALVIVPVSLAVQMVPISLNGFGVREAVFSYAFAAFALGAEAGLTLSLVSAVLITFFSLSGGLVFVTRRRLTIAPSPSDNCA